MSDDLLKRLDDLWHVLNDEGLYTRANTVYLAKKDIEQLETINEKFRGYMVDIARDYLNNCPESYMKFTNERLQDAGDEAIRKIVDLKLKGQDDE